jgi:hypothetical protein
MATKANLVIDQGTDFLTTITLTDDDGDPIDLSNYSGAGQIRKYYTSSNAVNFSVTADEFGVVSLSLSSAVTNTIPYGRYVYDVELTDQANQVSRIMEGLVTVTPGVTR